LAPKTAVVSYSWNWEFAPCVDHGAGLHVELVGLDGYVFGYADGQAFVEDAEAIGFFDGYFGGRSWCFGPAAAMS
jgi:hypothetical protein